MELKADEETVLLPHHVQQELCTTRLPYRQGRKLTAVKVYTINNESCHLLIFGVPSLNLRQEAKAQFMRFGKLKQFTLSKNHKSEHFTETYHAVYERIQSARYAKRMMDTKNYYGGLLHVTYAPEFETVEETRQKLMQRKRDVDYRLKKLEEEAKTNEDKKEHILETKEDFHKRTVDTIYMGDINEISVGKQPRDVIKKLKRKNQEVVIEKQFKPCFVQNSTESLILDGESSKAKKNKAPDSNAISDNIEIVDLSQTNQEVVTNIYESLNYNKFGSEYVKKIPQKPLNVIKFNK